ncbi:MAG: alpha/beta fold hydrolase [Candidatus Saccharimonadales bacterium]
MENDPNIIRQFKLKVSDGHTLQVWDWGNPEAATPIIVLHGGPGSQTGARHVAAFNPKLDRVILFDQRGCGLSTPYGSLESNTTKDSISDISAIADELKISKFILHGNSWGSTLALAYGVAHPERVSSMVIGGVFTGSKREAGWLDNGGFRTFYPDVWQAYLDRTPEEYRKNPSNYNFDKVLNGTAKQQKLSAYAYECLEASVIKLDDRFSSESFDEYDPAGMRIEMYYMKNGCFMPDEFIFKNTNKLTMPVYIVQGRYDMVCPPETAWRLHNLLPKSELYWSISGHAIEHENQNIFSSIFARLREVDASGV